MGIIEDPNDSTYVRRNGKTVRGEKRYREMMLRKTPNSKYSRVPRKSIRAYREALGCYSCDPKIRKEGRDAFNYLCMLGLHRGKEIMYNTGIIFVGQYRSGKDMMIDKLLCAPFDELECLELYPRDMKTNKSTSTRYALKKKDIEGKSEFNGYVKCRVITFSDILDSDSINKNISAIIGFFKNITGNPFATYRDLYKSAVNTRVDSLLVGASNEIIPVEKGMERISIIQIRTRGNLVKFSKGGKAIAERQGILRSVPWISVLRFNKGVGPLPDDKSVRVDFDYDEENMNKRDIYDVNSYTADEVEDNLDEGSLVVRDGEALGEWIRYESEMFWAWAHKRYTTHPKYKQMFSRFSPTIPLDNSALRQSQEMSNPSILFANEIRSGNVESIAEKFHIASVRKNDFKTILNAKPAEECTSGSSDRVIGFGPDGDRLYLSTIAWAINAINGNSDPSSKFYYRAERVEKSIRRIGLKITIDTNGGGLSYVSLPGIKQSIYNKLDKYSSAQSSKREDITF